MKLEASPLDIARWTYDSREDILRHVQIEYDQNGEVAGGMLWVDDNGQRLNVCPFLRGTSGGTYYCDIQDIKPEVCVWHYCNRYYPEE